MPTSLFFRRRGFTLVELMITVTIIALIAMIAVPNLMRARKRTQATAIFEDMRVIDQGLARWAIEKSKVGSDVATLADIQPYLKPGSKLYAGEDSFGNTYFPMTVDGGPKVSPAAFEVLSDVAPVEFWSPYQ